MINEKVKVIHIHTDYKFIHNSRFFEGHNFDNRTIVIQKKEPISGFSMENVLFFKNNRKGIREIVALCKNSDLVVLYDLDLIKSRIVIALPHRIKIAWRLFGHELYGKRKDIFVSNKSNEIRKGKSQIEKLKFNFRRLSRVIKYKKTPSSLFYKAIKRIDYMLGLSKEEYNFLCQYWGNLPEFIQLPHRQFNEKINLPDFKLKNGNDKPIIVLGNNRNIFNNHIDLIELIDKSPNKLNFKFMLLFNYGSTGPYAKAVRKAVEGKPYYSLIEEFIHPENFQNFYTRISALVINSYRQMAGTNIFMALRNGAKVYLNKNNVFLTWLRNEGFQVFTIEDFEKDLNNNNLYADIETAKYNIKRLVEFSSRYTKEAFQNMFYEKIRRDIN